MPGEGGKKRMNSNRNLSPVRRGILYALRTALLAVLVIAAGYFALQIGENSSNIYILATEGMQLRAECALQQSSRDALPEYFTPEFLQSDGLFTKDTYANYTITDYNYTLEVENVSVFPWSSSASMQAVERVERIVGQINKDSIPEGMDPAQFPLPEWEAARYRITFSRVDGRWYISGLKLLETAPQEAPRRTPRITPAPGATVAP